MALVWLAISWSIPINAMIRATTKTSAIDHLPESMASHLSTGCVGLLSGASKRKTAARHLLIGIRTQNRVITAARNHRECCPVSSSRVTRSAMLLFWYISSCWSNSRTASPTVIENGSIKAFRVIMGTNMPGTSRARMAIFDRDNRDVRADDAAGTSRCPN